MGGLGGLENSTLEAGSLNVLFGGLWPSGDERGLGDAALEDALIAGNSSGSSSSSLSSSESYGVAPSSSSGNPELRLVDALRHLRIAGNRYGTSCKS